MHFSELTIVCVTYGRPKYVARLINYWQTYFNEATIYILDGSSERLDNKYLETIFSNNINYIHMKNASIFKRYLFIKKILKTKYFQLVGDDEIFVRTGIKNSLEFLENNLKYSACCGKMILFTPLLKKEVFALSPYNLFSNKQAEGAERVKSWLAYSQPNTIYSIIRSQYFINILDECSKFNEKIFSKPEVFLESLIEIGLAYQGKTKIINDIMWLRSVENERIGLGDDKTQPEVTLFDNSQIEKKIFFDNFIKCYLKNLRNGENSFNNINLKQEYYKRLLMIKKNKNNNNYKNFFKFINIKNYLFTFIPKKIKKIIRYFLKLNGPEIVEFLENNKKNIIFNKKEIKDIKKFILDFHNDKFYN